MSDAVAGGVSVVTFGCRLNGVESDAMRRAATAAGFSDLVVVNTCAVTTEAARQARQAIRRLKRERPEAAIVATGCAAQVEPDVFGRMPEIAATLDNAVKTRPESWTALRDRILGQATSGSPLAEQVADAADGRTRAFIEVQNGCDHRCTFCIIPYGRGASRSVPVAHVVEKARSAVAAGHAEVVLTGVDLTSYGADLPEAPRLGALVKAVLAGVPDLPRLRLSSLDCVEVDTDLIDAFADQPRLMPHLHLSLQAGDDLVLKRMKRRHSHADAARFCARLRALRPDIVFGADLIAGFPTETEAMFARSLDLVGSCGLTHLHVFPYSARPGTPAARMPAVPGGLVRERAERLRARGAAALADHLGAQVGRTLRTLTERGGTGRSEDFTRVRVPGLTAGQIVDVRIAAHDGQGLIAARSGQIT